MIFRPVTQRYETLLTRYVKDEVSTTREPNTTERKTLRGAQKIARKFYSVCGGRVGVEYWDGEKFVIDWMN